MYVYQLSTSTISSFVVAVLVSLVEKFEVPAKFFELDVGILGIALNAQVCPHGSGLGIVLDAQLGVNGPFDVVEDSLSWLFPGMRVHGTT